MTEQERELHTCQRCGARMDGTGHEAGGLFVCDVCRRQHGAYSGIEYRSARQAILNAKQHGSRAIRLDGKILVITQHDADRLEAAGVAFTYLNLLDGRVVTVPVND